MRVLATATLIGLSSIAVAHEGPLDSYGCHTNLAAVYHCHAGRLAGQHFKSRAEMLRQLREQDAQVRAAERVHPDNPGPAPVPQR